MQCNKQILERPPRKIEFLNISQSCIYNADQTGLFYQKLPNQLYADKNAMRTTRGVKQMKSKERITLMVAIAADGSKVPLTIVGKAQQPECF